MQEQLVTAFSIADVVIALKTPFPITVSDKFRPFSTQLPSDYIVEFIEVEELPQFTLQKIYGGTAFDVVIDKKRNYLRRFRDRLRDDRIYAEGFYDWGKHRIKIQYVSGGIQNVNHTDGAFFHIAWEDMMLRKKRLILHACCVAAGTDGILFSGPSGIGKSTQGNLWCRHERAGLINGDRPILYKKAGVWTAFGSPYAGSSKCYVNESIPVRAIVMLRQAKNCSIRRLKAADAFQKVFAQLAVSTWNPECVSTVCELAEQMVMEVPVYEMYCTPDKNAVELLKNTLQQEGQYESKP